LDRESPVLEQERHDRSASWAPVQRAVFRPDPATKQSLALFGGAIVYNDGTPYWS